MDCAAKGLKSKINRLKPLRTIYVRTARLLIHDMRRPIAVRSSLPVKGVHVIQLVRALNRQDFSHWLVLPLSD
jgi:hypothetical protein